MSWLYSAHMTEYWGGFGSAMNTVVDFGSEEFNLHPERINLYFKSPIVVLKVRSMLASGYTVKASYLGDSLDIYDWIRVYITNPGVSKDARYFYTYEYGNPACENGLLKFLRSVEEVFH